MKIVKVRKMKKMMNKIRVVVVARGFQEKAQQDI